jgi:hypothetical protein
MGFPALDVGGFSRRSIIPQDYIDLVEGVAPGFIAQMIASFTARIYAQLRKRYGNNGVGNGLPFGNSAPPLGAQGTSPPPVVLGGVPLLGCIQIQAQITTPGPLGTAAFSLSADGGSSQLATGVVTSSLYPIPGTGMSLAFPVGVYSLDNLYSAPTPVPEAVLGWITTLVSLATLRKHRVDSNDPMVTLMVDETKVALEEVAQAANSNDGLFDLPINDSSDSGVKTGGPLWYSENSPYVGADLQDGYGRQEDRNGGGTYGGT